MAKSGQAATAIKTTMRENLVWEKFHKNHETDHDTTGSQDQTSLTERPLSNRKRGNMENMETKKFAYKPELMTQKSIRRATWPQKK